MPTIIKLLQNTSLLLFFLINTTYSQTKQINIISTIKDFPNQKISLVTISDYITLTEKIIAETKTDSIGNFSFSFQSNEILPVYIKWLNIKAFIYAEPGKTYILNIPSLDSLTNGKKERLYSIFPIEFYAEHNIKDSTELNNMIKKINFIYNSEILLNYQNITRSRKSDIIDSIKNVIINKIGRINTNDFILTYIDYKLAMLELVKKNMKKEQLAKKYLINKPIHYNNVEYMTFFNEFFNKYFTTNLYLKKEKDIKREIDDNASYTGLIKIMRSDSLIIANAELRELVLLKGLYEAYFSTDFKKENIVKIVDYIAKNSHINHHRHIAQNIIESFNRYSYKTTKPDISDITIYFKNEKKQIKDYKGKYLYVCVFNSWYKTALEEIYIMSNLKKKYDNWFDFIAICIDKNNNSLFEYFKSYKGAPLICYTDDAEKLISELKIEFYPFFFLLDMSGEIKTTNARRPSQNFEAEILKILGKPYNKKQKNSTKNK